MIAAIAETGRLVAIASGKGGVGKTWLSATLADGLARAGQRVLLVDWDFGLANLDVQLGLTPGCDMMQVLRRGQPISDAIINFVPRLDILAGSSGTGAMAGLDTETLDHLLAAVRTCAKDYDYVICDLAAGLDQGVRRMAATADLLLVVVTDEPTSLTDAYAVLKLHGRDGDAGRGEIIVNRAKSPPSGTRTYATLAHACTAFLGHTPPLAGVIRNDERVTDSIRRQTPLLTRHPNCPAAQDVEALVQRLLTCPHQPVQLARAFYA
ncbi:MAG: AAA family ATPase [Acetobacteraceae bacterium]|nr:AAA family ATPase [Acetobacteraceae bacterium]